MNGHGLSKEHPVGQIPHQWLDRTIGCLKQNIYKKIKNWSECFVGQKNLRTFVPLKNYTNNKNFFMTNIFKPYTIKVEANRKTKIYIWTVFLSMFSLLSFDMFFSEVKQVEVVHYLFVLYSILALSITYETIVNISGSERWLDGVFKFLFGFFQIILSCFVPLCVFLLCKANGWTDTSSLFSLILVSSLILFGLPKKFQGSEGSRLRVTIFKEV